MFRSVGAAAIGLVLITCNVRGDLINVPSAGICNWSVTESVTGGSFSGSNTLPFPANQSNGVNSAVGATGGHIDTLFTTAHTATSDRFDLTTTAVSGDMGTVKSHVTLSFTTSQWCAFTLQAQAEVYFSAMFQVVFNGESHWRSPNPTGWPPFLGDVPESPDWLTASGYLPPGTYTFEYEHTQSCWRFGQSASGQAAASLALQAVDPSQIPLPAALWLALTVAGPLLLRYGAARCR